MKLQMKIPGVDLYAIYAKEHTDYYLISIKEWLKRNHAYYPVGSGCLVFDTEEDMVVFKLKYKI